MQATRFAPAAAFAAGLITTIGAAAAALPTTADGNWINSPPMDLNSMSGKIIVLVYYEET